MTTNETITLYGVPHSLFTGRARSYFIKAGIAYRELPPNSPHYLKVVKPMAGNRAGIPTIELADGTVIRDGAAIIDHFEAALGHPFTPPTPKQNLFSLLFDVIGAEGLLRPAMHYRWNFDAENEAFNMFHFEMITDASEAGRARARKVADTMKNVATASFGVSAETVPVIEAVYADQLAALDRHFAAHGYLFGGRPSIGDFGMMAPLFAHLGRDPVSLALMQQQGKSVFRWVERMNRQAADLIEYDNHDEEWLASDAIPATLVDVLTAMAEDFVPETLAAAQCINDWLASQGDLVPGTECARGVGMGHFELRGVVFHALAQPYRFYLLKRFQDAYAALGDADRTQADAILEQSGMAPLIDVTLSRDIGRKDNLEVWM